jgi:hypothetical protein
MDFSKNKYKVFSQKMNDLRASEQTNAGVDMDKKKDKKDQVIHFYSQTNLPENGWFQGCDECGTITAKNILIYKKKFKHRDYHFYVYRCPICQASDVYKKEHYKEYTNECIDYIKKEYAYMFDEPPRTHKYVRRHSVWG